MPLIVDNEKVAQFNTGALDESMERLRYLLECTRRGLISCVMLLAALFLLVLVMGALLVSFCIFDQCGVFPASTLGITLIFSVPALFVMLRASANYAAVYTRHLEDYKNVVRVREFIRDMINSAGK
jgi:hypothetical protein